jgi:uncharacterized protein YecT (DUF1311 family)
MIRYLISAIGLASLLILISQSANGQTAPSFDCSKATAEIEKLICNDREIATADANMAELYALAQVSAFGRGTSNQLAAQREWLAGRTSCLTINAARAEGDTSDGRTDCLASNYRERNRELAVAILTTHPDVALGVLRDDSQDIAPLYEALQLYLTKPASAKWSDAAHWDKRDRIAALLKPYYADLETDDNKGYGLSVLSDIAASPDAAMSSDAKMGSTFAIISVYVSNDDGGTSVQFPCAAIVQRPAMISAAAPYFGSTLDNFLPPPDCEHSLPAQPRLNALAKALNAFWTDDCGGGTIRFAYYRSYAQLEHSARIGLPVEQKQARSTLLARKGLNSKLVTTAIAELADQYARYNGLSKPEAEKRARFWLGRMIADAGECDS